MSGDFYKVVYPNSIISKHVFLRNVVLPVRGPPQIVWTSLVYEFWL